MAAESVTQDGAGNAWHARSVEEAMQVLHTSMAGLKAEEAAQRLAHYGPNALPPPPRRSAWMRFLGQFGDVLVLVLLGAAVVTVLLGHFVDAAVIVGVTVLNALIGFVQEGRAERALDAIRDMLTPVASVLRDGRRYEIAAAELVPGDVVLLAEGDRVPADLRLVEAKNLRIEESVLTGEAEPVEKQVDSVAADAVVGDRFCMAHSGTLAVYGMGRGVVVATGLHTEIGRISSLLAQVEPLSTPLLRKMADFGRMLTIVICALAVVAFVLGVWLRGYPMSDMFMMAVGLAVAAIPEGLPAIVTITLAIGVQRMAGRNAIVRRLPAVETLGSVTVICTDKTGTLTRNEMTVKRVELADCSFAVGGAGYAPHGGISADGAEVEVATCPVLVELARAAALCNDAVVRLDAGTWRMQGDPTEGALVTLALKAGIEQHLENEAWPRLDVLPFAAEHRFMATLHHDHAGHACVFIKGAPEVIVPRCITQHTAHGDVALQAERWVALGDALARDGLRVLALAVKRPPRGQLALRFEDAKAGFALLGLVGIIDPPRQEAVRAVAQCRSAGIRVKMITGDHAITARAIGAQIGLGADHAGVLTGAELEAMSDVHLQDAALATDIFARASPTHKLRLVQALQARGAVVAMTGDGVNDAPALKRADVGVAMGVKGTEAAKEAAGMVLADDNFASIAHAVEEGRTVYDNIKKSILYILPTNGGETGVILVAMLLGMQMPITAVQILWINMVTEVTLSLSLAFLPAQGMVMQRPPRDPAEPLISRFLMWRIVLVSALMIATSLGTYLWEIGSGSSVAAARTAAVNMIVMGEIAYLLNSRSLYQSILSVEGIFANRPAWIAVGIITPLQIAFTHLPVMQTLFGTADITMGTWGHVALGGVLILLCVEGEKWVMRRVGEGRAE